MRRYLFLFFLFLAVLLSIISLAGASITTRALRMQDTESLTGHTRRVQERLRQLYRMVEGDEEAENAVETAAGEVDALRGELALFDARKNYFQGVALYITAMILVTGVSGFFLWLWMTRIFIRPLDGIVSALRKIGKGNFDLSFKPARAKEIRFVQEQVVELAAEVWDSQEKIREMERQNIGRYLVHQVRNSITPIRLCLDVLNRGNKRGGPEAPEQQESLQIIAGETDKIEELITRFRSLYAFPEPVMGEIEICSMLRSLIGKYPNVSLKGCGEKLYIRGDRNLLEQAVGNIIDNAVEADQSEGEPRGVRAAVTQSGKGPVLEVEDRGPGIPAEIRDSLFTDFRTTKRHGMGIGLSFVKRVLDLHGFSIRIDSAEGEGTTVQVNLHE